jgi:RsiW-degrading membrane proteinase PrsW (M82 family)
MGAELLGKLLVGVLPVVCFLASLIYLDSYKLVRFRAVVYTILWGAASAGLGYAINVFFLLGEVGIDPDLLKRYAAPVVEELLKAAAIIYLVRSKRVGFLVDAAIFGFAVGTGFALVENIYYLEALPDSIFIIWIVRGFGTAIMHGGTTAIFGIISKTLAEERDVDSPLQYAPGILVAIAVHSFFNHFFLSPVFSAMAVLLLLPPLIFVVFHRSEASLERWLGVGFDSDAELLERIHSGEFSESRIGRYLQSLRARFEGVALADMLCYLRLHVELSLRAKGVLLARESGFDLAPDPQIAANLEELRYLEGSIGKTGKLALAPFLRRSSRDLWQLHMLGGK